MAIEKVFDKADLLRFFVQDGDEAIAGKFTVITPSKTLFGETETMRYPVAAKVEAFYCEKYALSILVQSIVFVDGGRNRLPKDHALLQRPTVSVRYGGNSAKLVRLALDTAEAWRNEVRDMLPTSAIDFTQPAPFDDDHTPTGETIDDVISRND